MLEPPLSENCKGLTMKLEVTYPFPTSSPGANFFICQLSECLAIRKILAHGIRMQKNQQTTAHVFWIFPEFQSYPVSYSNLHPRTEISALATLTPKWSLIGELQRLMPSSMRH